MKRILAAILAIILCLGLCACSGVKQEVYDAAMSSYDAAKAGYDELSSKYDELKSKVDKYSTVIEALEKEDYDGAIEAVNAMRPAPVVTEVEITMDNLWDYFEVAENRNEQTDANGKPYSLYVSRYLSLKDNYKLANKEEYPTDVAVGFEYDSKNVAYTKPSSVDFEGFTISGTIVYQDKTHESHMAHYPSNPSLDHIMLASDSKSDLYDAMLTTTSSFKVLNASGTLYLVNK